MEESSKTVSLFVVEEGIPCIVWETVLVFEDGLIYPCTKYLHTVCPTMEEAQEVIHSLNDDSFTKELLKCYTN